MPRSWPLSRTPPQPCVGDQGWRWWQSHPLCSPETPRLPSNSPSTPHSPEGPPHPGAGKSGDETNGPLSLGDPPGGEKHHFSTREKRHNTYNPSRDLVFVVTPFSVTAGEVRRASQSTRGVKCMWGKGLREEGWLGAREPPQCGEQGRPGGASEIEAPSQGPEPSRDPWKERLPDRGAPGPTRLGSQPHFVLGVIRHKVVTGPRARGSIGRAEDTPCPGRTYGPPGVGVPTLSRWGAAARQGALAPGTCPAGHLGTTRPPHPRPHPRAAGSILPRGLWAAGNRPVVEISYT